MSAYTDARLEAFSQATGIRPVEGEAADVLADIKSAAINLLEAVTLEQCGIRGGNGRWQGSNAVSSYLQDLALLGFMFGNEIYDRRVAEFGTFPMFDPEQAKAIAAAEDQEQSTQVA